MLPRQPEWMLAITFFPLALLPFGVFVPAMTIVMLGVGITTRDGLVVLLGMGAAAAFVSLFLAWPL